MKSATLSMFLFLGASIAGAATLTVTPNGKYSTVCSALIAANNGDTVLVDANHGIPYIAPPNPQHSDGRADCEFSASNLTVKGINGRPILDAGTGLIEKGIFVIDGHDVVIDNLEFRNANETTNPDSSSNAAGIRIQDGAPGTPAGGNITVTECYIHNNGDGILSGNSGPGVGQWFSPHPFLTFSNDDFYLNGAGDGETHNMYIGYDGYLTMHFTLKNSRSRDAYIGHDVKTRAPYNYILNNQISDTMGATSYLLDFCLGGTSYVTGNILYKSAATNPNANYNLMIYADVNDNTSSDPEYAIPNQDLHFQNNVVVDDNQNNSDSFVNVSCDQSPNTACPAPPNGPPVTTPAVISSNLFIGLDKDVTNQTIAKAKFNLVLPYSDIAALGYKAALK